MNIAKVAQKTKDGLETANKKGKVLKTFWKHALAQAAPAPVVQRSEFQITHFVVRSKRTFNEINDSRWQSTDSIHFELVCVCVCGIRAHWSERERDSRKPILNYLIKLHIGYS